jgi:cellobiose phosphorylase
VFALLQAILGLSLDAPRGKIFVDPVLPHWLPDITLFDLRLGRGSYDIKFWREDETTRFEVLRGQAEHVEQRAFMPVG